MSEIIVRTKRHEGSVQKIALEWTIDEQNQTIPVWFTGLNASGEEIIERQLLSMDDSLVIILQAGEQLMAWRPTMNTLLGHWTPYRGTDWFVAEKQLYTIIHQDDMEIVQAWVRELLSEFRLLAGRCDDCSARTPWGDECDLHALCSICDEFNTRNDMLNSYIVDENRETGPQAWFCQSHNGNELVQCSGCGYFSTPENAHRNVVNHGNTRCASCIQRYTTCDECNRWVNSSHYYPSWNMCDTCMRNDPNFGTVLHYSYKPTPDFQPPMPELEKGIQPLYMGMELETSFKQGKDPNGLDVMRMLGNEEVRSLVYAKRDSSVNNGFEIVTHPMQPAWARSNFPFDWFQRLIDDFDALPTHESTGCHIHLNRASFTKGHYWKYVQLHTQLATFVGSIGGRGHQHNQGSLIRLQGQLQQPNALMTLVKGKDNNEGRMARQATGINFSNVQTIELRYPRGGIAPSEIKKNIEWIEASFSFTKYITVADVKDGALATAGNLLWWINSGDYPNLSEWVERFVPQPRPLAQRSI